MKSPIEVLLNVVGLSGRLRIVDGQLRMLLPADCRQELKDNIREHKPDLLDLMRLTFLVVHSGTLNSIVFFVPDDVTKESLVAAGAEPGSIYTKAELRSLVQQRTTADELRLIHAAKQRFNGKVANR